MKLSENWLREWVDPGVDRETLCTRLDMIGLEVESVETLGAGLDGVVVARIVSAVPHPDADRLRVCEVDAGDARLQIVCGAPNAREGLLAPLARVGARLPGGLEIKAASLRGVESQGMLCSARELGIDADAAGLMELPAEAVPGTPLATLLGLPDAVIELGLTPNRADCLGMLGLAVDVGAAFAVPVCRPAIADVPAQVASSRAVALASPAACPRYLGRVVEGVDASRSSPPWLAERLRRAGIRPINAVIDVTAYVMLELGQPMHAFDQAHLHGDIVVRHAAAGERLVLLDGRELVLDPDLLVIADARAPVALAGIMGGMDSRVTETTRDVFLEAAHFAPAAIIGRARRLGMHTDASHRFERGVDPALPRLALERATALLVELAGGRPGPVVEAMDAGHLRSHTQVPLRRSRIGRLLGIEVADAEVERILAALDMAVERCDAGWRVTPPGRRFDIAIEEDLIEEVARIHGYDNIPVRPPGGELAPALPSEAQLADSLLRRSLAARDWQEAITFAFVDQALLERWQLAGDALALGNPLSAELGVMRTSLLPGLVQALAHNRARQVDRVRLFELGRRFHAAAGERDSLAMVACGPAHTEHWAGRDRRGHDFHDLKGELEALIALGGEPEVWSFAADALPAWLHPGRAATVSRDGRPVGWIGALHPALLRRLDLDHEVIVAELDLDALRGARVPKARALSRFPSVRRDIAVKVDAGIPYQALASVAREALGSRLEDLVVFDEYRGAGLSEDTKSIAMGLILRDPSRTLTDDDADRAVAAVVHGLNARFGAELRG
ncbi:MAG: phenylalanine--tRNA ligase subunit beta [Xanthomonadales bacterium]|nr:phenylalanine--tRNA ligase subunit beta [Xanthomonadales bacterium]